MRRAAEEVSTTVAGGSVRGGFSVAFPDGERVEHIRVDAVDGADVEVLPRRRRIVVGSLPRTSRMPARHLSRLAAPPERAA